jgi:hypothetical protein
MLEMGFEPEMLVKVTPDPAGKPYVGHLAGSRLQPVHVELFEDSASHRVVRVPVGVNQVSYSMNFLSLEAQADIFWSVEQNAWSLEEERRPITDKPTSLASCFLTHVTETASPWSRLRAPGS